MIDFMFGLTDEDLVYDIETYPNCFTFTAMQGDRMYYFEISEYRDDFKDFRLFMDTMRCRMVGFNNIGFDYPVIHAIYHDYLRHPADIYRKAMSIINAPHNARFAHIVWESDWLVEQIDLYKICHFDNMARATSLKVLEFNMRSDNIEDLP